MLIQKLFRLIDLRRQIRTTASIGVIQQHQLAVLLADDIFRYASFAEKPL